MADRKADPIAPEAYDSAARAAREAFAAHKSQQEHKRGRRRRRRSARRVAPFVSFWRTCVSAAGALRAKLRLPRLAPGVGELALIGVAVAVYGAVVVGAAADGMARRPRPERVAVAPAPDVPELMGADVVFPARAPMAEPLAAPMLAALPPETVEPAPPVRIADEGELEQGLIDRALTLGGYGGEIGAGGTAYSYSQNR